MILDIGAFDWSCMWVCVISDWCESWDKIRWDLSLWSHLFETVIAHCIFRHFQHWSSTTNFGDTSSTRAAQYLLYSHFLCTQKNIHISCKPHDTTVFGPLRRTTPPWTRQQGVVASQFCPSYPSFSRTRSRFLLPSRPYWSASSLCNSIFALSGKTLPDYPRRVPYLCPLLLHSTGPELQNTQFV